MAERPRFQSINPTDGLVISEHRPLSDDGLEGALAAAAGAEWPSWPLARRCGVLGHLGELMRERQHELALLATREMGKPVTESIAEVQKCATLCEHFSQNADAYLQERSISAGVRRVRVSAEPLGALLSITPWNFPYWQVLRFAVPVLVAGNVIVHKHAPNVFGCAQALEHLMLEAGAPPDVFQTLVIGHDQAARVIADDRIRGVAITGSGAAGATVAALAGRHLKRAHLELGGSDAFLVLDDADVEGAARAACVSRFRNCGQVCSAAKRLLVHEAVFDDFLEGLVRETRSLVMADPELERTTIGPMARSDLRDKLAAQYSEALYDGASDVLRGGAVNAPGFFFRPAVIAAPPLQATVMREETFGPLAVVVRTSSDAHSIKLANDTPFGLAAAVWTRNRSRGERIGRQLEVGSVTINGITETIPGVPFGGVKTSGAGRELGQEGCREFTNTKTYNLPD